jgi:hypothetical protein
MKYLTLDKSKGVYEKSKGVYNNIRARLSDTTGHI